MRWKDTHDADAGRVGVNGEREEIYSYSAMGRSSDPWRMV